MPAEVMDAWLRSGRCARLNGGAFRPLEHCRLKGTPLSIQRGQAEAFFLEEEGGGRQILKKFHCGFSLDRDYLERVASLLPDERGFESGVQRHVVDRSDHRRRWGCYYKSALAAWLDGTLLMPVVSGMDWATVADDLRAGVIRLDFAQRIRVARSLCELIVHLEFADCSHRDLSSGNVFIDPDTWNVSLIDFDSLFHPSLSMPNGTTGGTMGYAAPFAWSHDALDARRTWCPHADRFALAILIIEILTLDAGSPLTADGGMFDQDELRAGSGPGLRAIAQRTKRVCPGIEPPFDMALGSTSFEDCPCPGDWIGILDSASPVLLPPMSRVSQPTSAPATRQVNRVPSSCNVPQLCDLPLPVIELSGDREWIVALPSDPWKD